MSDLTSRWHKRAVRGATRGLLVYMLSAAAFADPLVTIQCEMPKGVGRYYGVPESERLKAAADHKPPPTGQLSAVYQDGYSQRAMFIVESSRTQLTRIWLENDTDRNRREQQKTLGLSATPGLAVSIPVVSYTPESITAMEYGTDYFRGASVYSFFPKLGMMFLSQQLLDADGLVARQLALVAKCEFAWSRQP